MTREERAYNYASKKNPSKFTVTEIAKHYDDGYSDCRKEMIDKACEWMSRHLQMQYDGFSAFIKDFRKAMEE